MSKEQWIAEHQQPGELYAGLILGEDEAPDYHVFLLPGEAEKVTFKAAQDWAKKQGGDLPTRREQSLLFANRKAEFQRAWYWSGEQHASDSGGAWYRSFFNGDQYSSIKSAELRARAVRRSII